MKTEDLIATLSTDVSPVSRAALPQRLLLAASIGTIAALIWVGALFGFRTDLATAIHSSALWTKLGYTIVIALFGYLALERASRPGTRFNTRLALIAAPFAILLALGAFELATAPAPDRAHIWLGYTWRVCSLCIALLSLPTLALMLIALRRFAPTRPGVAGFAAGILSGGLAATAYGLHCPEVTSAFVGTWYALGILVSAIVGALAGRLFLRW